MTSSSMHQENCIFCKIVRKEIPSMIIFENEHVLAILDIRPINPGHTLVIPKKHSETFYEADSNDFKEMTFAAQQIAQKIATTLKPKKVGLLVAGWDVSHTHIHVVPMQDSFDLTSKRYLDHEQKTATTEELERIAKRITFI